MKKFSIFVLMTALSLIAAAVEKKYPLIQGKMLKYPSTVLLFRPAFLLFRIRSWGVMS
ncbi:MAG: hypothetical protein L6W00_01790 [Lentisphaeria bacterium]|nr:MAG: hypothetical protein L6W00_01790 [Lentisphaeria bacterium]